MSLRKPLGTSDVSSGFLCRNLRRKVFINWVFYMECYLGMTASDFCNLQSFIKAHFAHEWLADPVDEGLWFLCGLRAAAGHLQFHHFTLSILRNKAEVSRIFCENMDQMEHKTLQNGYTEGKTPTEGSKHCEKNAISGSNALLKCNKL